MGLFDVKQTWSRLRVRLNWAVDPEPEQAVKIRLPIATLLVLIFCLPWSGEQSFLQNLTSLPGLIFFIHWIMALVIIAAIIKKPQISPFRRVSGISIDIISLSAVMFLATEYTLPLFVMYLWVILGNGFRYGVNYLYITSAISLVCFITVITTGRFWLQNPSIGISLLIILFVLPLYSAFLLKKLHLAIKSAKQANKAKSQFLANMSHELRTPLNGVIGMGYLLRETKLSFEQQELVTSMHSSANTLLELIENVLDISKIEAGKILVDSKPFDLHALINSVLYMLAPMGESKGLHVSCHIDPDVPFSLNGDQVHLRQVLINLLNNAIKFTEKGSVSMNVYRSGGSEHKPTIRFDIIDTGIGIKQDVQQHIFDNFTQADAGISRSYGGTGLGTTISRDLVVLMGGEIAVISEPGKGSTFWVELPFEVLAHGNDDISDNKVLLLANEETASIIRPSLKSWSVNFDWVRSAARAFSSLVSAVENYKGYEIVIVDQAAMSDMSPVQFAQMVKAEKEMNSISMILLNSSDSVIESNMLNRYFIATLETADDKRLLFNSIHAAQNVDFNDTNVVPLSEHYKQQGYAKELDILVAEDNLVNQQVIVGILKHAGHRVRVTDNGEKALDILSRELDNIDLLILDMNMPEKSGVEVVKLLRFMDTDQPIPVIMLTADATPQARENCLNAGANSFLTKPVDARLLIEKVALLTRHIKSKHKKIPVTEGRTINTGRTNRFGESAWFNGNILEELINLGDGMPFIRNLVKGFIKDSRKHIENIKKYGENDYPAYRESLHALKGSSTELGAEALVKICLKGEALKPYDIGTEKITFINSEVEKIFKLTVSALQDAVSDKPVSSPQNKE